MKYILENIALRKVAEGKRNAGSLFIQADAVNPDDIFDEGGRVTIFNERLCNKYAEYLTVAVQNGTDRFGREVWKSTLKDANKPIPESMTVMTHAKFEQYVFPGGPKIALDSNGEPIINQKTNEPVMRSAIYVFTKKAVDNETGEIDYIRNWDPISVGQRIEANFYKTPDVQTAGGVVLPQGDDPLLTNSASDAAAAAAPAAPASAPAAPATA
jgi:hypothetical protein